MKWEYKATRLLDKFDRATGDGIRLAEVLNEFGQDEWELMSVDLEQDCFIFKRPVSLSFMEQMRNVSNEQLEELHKILDRGQVG